MKTRTRLSTTSRGLVTTAVSTTQPRTPSSTISPRLKPILMIPWSWQSSTSIEESSKSTSPRTMSNRKKSSSTEGKLKSSRSRMQGFSGARSRKRKECSRCSRLNRINLESSSTGFRLNERRSRESFRIYRMRMCSWSLNWEIETTSTWF